jgi:hypothetical protein
VPVSSPTGIWGAPWVASAEVHKPGDSFEWSMSYRFSKLLKKEFMASTAQYLPNGTDVFVSGKPIDMRVVSFLALNGQDGDRRILSVTQSRLWELSLNNRNISKANMRLYPNPANEHALLVTEMTGEKQIVLLNAAGRVIREFTTRDSAILISTETLSDGVYYLQCVSADNSKQATLLVRH